MGKTPYWQTGCLRSDCGFAIIPQYQHFLPVLDQSSAGILIPILTISPGAINFHSHDVPGIVAGGHSVSICLQARTAASTVHSQYKHAIRWLRVILIQ